MRDWTTCSRRPFICGKLSVNGQGCVRWMQSSWSLKPDRVLSVESAWRRISFHFVAWNAAFVKNFKRWARSTSICLLFFWILCRLLFFYSAFHFAGCGSAWTGTGHYENRKIRASMEKNYFTCNPAKSNRDRCDIVGVFINIWIWWLHFMYQLQYLSFNLEMNCMHFVFHFNFAKRYLHNQVLKPLNFLRINDKDCHIPGKMNYF